MPTYKIVLIVIVVLAVLGGIGYGVYYFLKKKKSKNTTPVPNNDKTEDKVVNNDAVNGIINSLPKQVELKDYVNLTITPFNNYEKTLIDYRNEVVPLVNELARYNNDLANAKHEELTKYLQEVNKHIDGIEQDKARREKLKKDFSQPTVNNKKEFVEKYKEYLKAEFDSRENNVLQERFPFGKIGNKNDYDKVKDIENVINYIPDLAPSFFNWIVNSGLKYYEYTLKDLGNKIDVEAMLKQAAQDALTFANKNNIPK